MLLIARDFRFSFPRPAMVMGIINVTPDSFSDGGQFLDPDAAVAHGLKLVEEGAEMLDIGGESSRPNANPVEAEEEMRRVLPVIQKLAGLVKVPISVDSTKPEVARAAIAGGASIINDIGASRADLEMFKLVSQTGAGYVCMHMQGTPATMQINPVYSDVVLEVAEFFQERINRLQACGVRSEQIILDPGIGFGKTVDHNLQLLGALEKFSGLGRPVMLGASRKAFIGKLFGTELASRLPGSLACAVLGVRAGGQIIRAHDVAETLQAIRVAEAISEKTI
jgi:dihydropteroate synthase